MKRILKPLLFLIFILGFFYVVFWDREVNFLTCRSVEIGEKTFILERAFTPKDRESGLSNRADIGLFDGMIFEFEKYGRYGFWMKDMSFPIDILFINEDTISDIFSNVSPESFPESFFPSRDINRVIELSANSVFDFKIKVGEKIKISKPKRCFN